MRLLFLLVIISPFCQTIDEELEYKSETELKPLFQEEKFVITLFSEKEKCSGSCQDLEDALLSIREDIVEETGGWVVRSYAPTLAKQLGIHKSAIIFMREGRPLLYPEDGKNEEHLFSYLTNNKEATVHNLTDATFEHQTQAGSGSTTGDWLVMFTKEGCEKCGQLLPSLECVGVNLKGRKNVAFVERDSGGVTARRFGVKEFPSFILFRQGKLYKYNLPLHDINSLTAFALDGFRNAKAESVPNPKSPFDDLTEATVDWLKDNPGTFIMCTGAVFAALAILILLNVPVPESWTKKSKSKKKR